MMLKIVGSVLVGLTMVEGEEVKLQVATEVFSEVHKVEA